MDDPRLANSSPSSNLGLPAPVVSARPKPKPKLFTACCKGTHFPEVVIEL